MSRPTVFAATERGDTSSRGWRHGKIVVGRWVTTQRNGTVTTRIRLAATTRFDLRRRATSTIRAATSTTSIRWRVS